MFGTSTKRWPPGTSASRRRATAWWGSLRCSTTCHAQATSNSPSRQVDLLDEPGEHRYPEPLSRCPREVRRRLHADRFEPRVTRRLDEVPGGRADLEQPAAAPVAAHELDSARGLVAALSRILLVALAARILVEVTGVVEVLELARVSIGREEQSALPTPMQAHGQPRRV